MPKDYRLPLSGVSTHKSINPYSLKVINPDETVTTYDGSKEATIDLSDSQHAEQADKVILASKQYTNVIGTANADADCRFYFLQIRPSTWSAAWHVKLKLTVFVNNNLQAYGHYECVVTGERDKTPAYANFNTYYDDSHWPIYNTALYVLTEAGYTNGQAALFGIDLRQAWNGYNSSYKRTVNVELIEADNCQCSFLNSASKAAEISNVNTTNYHSVYTMNAHEYGLQETGDYNIALRVYRQTTGYDDDYPFLVSRTKTIGTQDVNNSYTSIYGAIANAKHPTINLATGVVKVPGGIVSTVTGNLIGNADSATEFASNATVTLKGDTTGVSAGSKKSWTVTTKTDRLSTEGDHRAVATTPNDYNNKLIFRGLKTNSSFGSPSSDSYSYVIGLRGWCDSSGGDAHELAFNNSGIYWRHGATTVWGAWEKLVTSINYVNYTVTHDGVGATGTWGINITGNAATATTATNLSAKPSLAKSGNNITVTVGGKTSDAFTVPYATSAGSATHANYLTGFSSRASTMTWGNQTGSVITCLASPAGGGWGFRDNNPTNGQLSMTIDGTIYIKEGTQDISAAIKSLSISNATVSYTNLWGGTGTAFTIPTTAGTSTLAWNTEVTLGTIAGLAIKAKLPANPNVNTDTLVKQTVKTDNVNYKLLATTNASPSSGTAMEATYSANIFANPSTGALSAPQHMLNISGTNKAYMQYNSTDDSIDFVFI